nr:hypothetical protein [Acinetobacter tjernbergiae]
MKGKISTLVRQLCLNNSVFWLLLYLKNKNDETQNIMFMITAGTHKQRKSAIQNDASIPKQNDFYQNFNKHRSAQFFFWNYKHPAEQHLTNLICQLTRSSDVSWMPNSELFKII